MSESSPVDRYQSQHHAVRGTEIILPREATRLFILSRIFELANENVPLAGNVT